ncbi:DNA-3-methyladenine glycosylase family protein [Xanthomarina sp. F2636L]|uniref:DNA-3-methyladenine glycosylase family protein n=1 Tax=Xanthomarina sp. F2636L TaxID=2996018 RepID=UPI00225E0082|nr:hypothetical protein [Xanthomarina sp. F2636L]MCX7550886.1 hypothetical protein [Xanthomarina sp. F2636L]
MYLEELKSSDKVMRELIERLPKFNLDMSCNPFYDLVRSIISQQLSVKAASTIYSRFINLIGENYSALELNMINIDELKSVGISTSKCNYIKNVASKLLDEPGFFNRLKKSPNEEVIKDITTIKGVGIWTAQMFLMFSLGRIDVLPTADIGIQNAVQKFYQLDAKPSIHLLEKIALKWKPYRTIACWYLWQGLDAKIVLKKNLI